jgi:hypothetical protein
MPDKYNDNRTQFRHARIASGVCRDCGINKPWFPKVMCESCFLKRQITNKIRNSKPRGRCKYCPTATMKTLCSACMTRAVDVCRIRRGRNRKTVVAAYGGKCTLCEENDIRCLSLDHINNDGAQDRKRENGKKMGSIAFYAKLYKEVESGILREDLELLCFNCHARKDLHPAWLE